MKCPRSWCKSTIPRRFELTNVGLKYDLVEQIDEEADRLNWTNVGLKCLPAGSDTPRRSLNWTNVGLKWENTGSIPYEVSEFELD